MKNNAGTTTGVITNDENETSSGDVNTENNVSATAGSMISRKRIYEEKLFNDVGKCLSLTIRKKKIFLLYLIFCIIRH